MLALTLENWPVARLRDYEKNPRKNDQAVDRMVANIKEFGFRIPVLARSSGEIVDGHLRLKAARAMQIATVPVLLADDMTEAQVKAFRIAVNKSAEWADWDDDLLRGELAELGEMGFDMTLTGFDPGELNHALNGWDTDMSRIEKVSPELTVLEALVKVRCASQDVQRVVEAIQGALRAAAIEGAKVVE